MTAIGLEREGLKAQQGNDARWRMGSALKSWPEWGLARVGSDL